MPSNSYHSVRNLNRDGYIDRAYRAIGVLATGQTLTGDQTEKGAERLNQVLAILAANDIRGEFATVRKRATLFLQYNQGVYSLGSSSTDHATTSYSQTTAGAAIAASQTSIQVASSASMTIGDQVGVLLTSGSWEWHTIASVPDGTHYTIASPGMTGTAASGATIVNYTTALASPVEILNAVLRDTTSQDTLINTAWTLKQYQDIGDKTTLGDPANVYIEYGLTTGLYFDVRANDASKIVPLVVRMPFSELTTSTDTLDCSDAGVLAVIYKLAAHLASSNQKSLTPEFRDAYADATLAYTGENRRNSNDYFQPGLD